MGNCKREKTTTCLFILRKNELPYKSDFKKYAKKDENIMKFRRNEID